MKNNNKINEEDCFNEKDFSLIDEETQKNIDYLKKNLTEESLYTQLFNNFNFKEIMDQLYYQELEQEYKLYNKLEENEDEMAITKYNMFMILYNECEFPIEDHFKFNKFFDYEKKLSARKLTIQYCEEANTKLSEIKKQYYYIPITDEILFHHNNEIIIIFKERINQNKITTLSIFDKSEYNDKIKLFEKSKKKEEFKFESKYEVLSESEFKEKFEKEYEAEFIYLQKHKYYTSNSGQSSQQHRVKTDNSENEVNGERFYIIGDKKIKRFIFINSYKKSLDGFYSRHKDINLGIDEEVNNFDDNLFNYNINNDLKAHILFKNFKGNIIPKDKPIILEIKKNFKIYDLLTQIKQISKMANNFYEIDGIKNSDFPEYIIGIMCNNHEGLTKHSNIMKIYETYKNISLLQHDIDIINRNNIKVIICAIKDEKILGYDLSKPDYDIEGSNAKYEVDLFYLSQKIFPNENKKELLNNIFEEYKYKYDGLISEKDIRNTIKNIQDENKILKSKWEQLQKELKQLEQERKLADETIKKEEIIIELLKQKQMLENELKNEKEKNKNKRERSNQESEDKKSSSAKNINEEQN